jgi:hypothetical protein
VKNSARAARVAVSADGSGLVSQGPARWRAPRAVHDPGKVAADPAAAVALGGDCLADIAVLREQSGLAGPVGRGYWMAGCVMPCPVRSAAVWARRRSVGVSRSPRPARVQPVCDAVRTGGVPGPAAECLQVTARMTSDVSAAE